MQKHRRPLLFLSLQLAIILLNGCHAEVKVENGKDIKEGEDGSAEVTSFPIEREENASLANWEVFKDGNEIITTPPGWSHYVKDQNLTISPPNSLENNERLVFSRIAKDNPSLDYEKVGQRLAELTFRDFTVSQGDTIKKIKFQKDFCFERNVALSKNGANYTGYFLAYINDSTIYQYDIILSSKSLNDYKGSLIKDIIGNLQINKKYIISNENPLISILYTRKK